MQRTLTSIKFIILCLLSGCGYHFGQATCSNYETISIPFALGDEKGYLTSSLVKEINARTPWRYTACDGDLELLVTFKEKDADNIGYQFAPRQTVDNKRVIVAQEARLNAVVCVTLKDRRTGENLFGPIDVDQTITFDFEPDFSNINFHAFSLGQLEMYPLAERVASDSLDNLLAEKIVDTLIFCW